MRTSNCRLANNGMLGSERGAAANIVSKAGDFVHDVPLLDLHAWHTVAQCILLLAQKPMLSAVVYSRVCGYA